MVLLPWLTAPAQRRRWPGRARHTAGANRGCPRSGAGLFERLTRPPERRRPRLRRKPGRSDSMRVRRQILITGRGRKPGGSQLCGRMCWSPADTNDPEPPVALSRSGVPRTWSAADEVRGVPSLCETGARRRGCGRNQALRAPIHRLRAAGQGKLWRQGQQWRNGGKPSDSTISRWSRLRANVAGVGRANGRRRSVQTPGTDK